jgi:hypothetical protein
VVWFERSFLHSPTFAWLCLQTSVRSSALSAYPQETRRSGERGFNLGFFPVHNLCKGALRELGGLWKEFRVMTLMTVSLGNHNEFRVKFGFPMMNASDYS